jgi:hypothetical protein
LSNITPCAPHAIDEHEFLRAEWVEIRRARRARAARLRRKCRKIMLDAPDTPRALSTFERMIEAMFLRFNCYESEVAFPKYENPDELSVTRLGVSRNELERVGSEIAAAIDESGLPNRESYRAVHDGLCDVAQMFPGY